MHINKEKGFVTFAAIAILVMIASASGVYYSLNRGGFSKSNNVEVQATDDDVIQSAEFGLLDILNQNPQAALEDEAAAESEKRIQATESTGSSLGTTTRVAATSSEDFSETNDQIKKYLSDIRSRAEALYRSSGDSYARICSDASIKSGGSKAQELSGSAYLCRATEKSWAFSIPLKTSSAATSWCADYSGYAGIGIAVYSSADRVDHVCDRANSKDLTQQYYLGQISKVSDMPRPSLLYLSDNVAALAQNQFHAGNEVSVWGLSLGNSMGSYNGTVYIDGKFAARFGGASSNGLAFISPQLTVGSHQLHIVGDDGRKSNTLSVYAVSQNAVAPLAASVDLKVNGSASIVPLRYGEPFTFSWNSTNVSDSCVNFGQFVERASGGRWQDSNLQRSGSVNLIAKPIAYPESDTLTIGVQCFTSNLESVMDSVSIPLIRLTY